MRKKMLLLISLFLLASPAIAFQQLPADSEQATCNSCHNLTMPEAKDIFTGFQGEVISVDQAEIHGFWQIGMKVQNQNIPLYLDYSKSYLVSGNIIRIKDRKNLTEESFRELNPIDISRIPTEDALILGDPAAKNKIIVFTDPHCPYCAKLHEVMKEAVAKRTDLQFLIKLLPLKQSSRKIAESIACGKSLEYLDDAYAKKKIPDAACESKTIEQNLALARSLGIRSTPTLVLPNGQIAPGYKPLEPFLDMIDQTVDKD